MTDANAIASAYVAAWNERDEAARLTRLAALLAEEMRYSDAHMPIPLAGQEAFLQFATLFRQRLPDLTLDPRGSADGRFGWFRFPWRLVRDDGSDFSFGSYVGEFDEAGRIVRMHGFMDQ
jgi:hypothetical protein